MSAARCVVQDAREEKSENLVKVAHFCICIGRSFKAQIIVFNCNAMHFYSLLWFLLTLKLSPFPSAALQSRKFSWRLWKQPKTNMEMLQSETLIIFSAFFLHRRHAGSYICGVCGKKYKYYNCFQTHVRAHRGKSSIYIYLCITLLSLQRKTEMSLRPPVSAPELILCFLLTHSPPVFLTRDCVSHWFFCAQF